jgi:cytoplasmic iron level regulating protein YaaA (DUF328/UPF0246 family)
MVILLSPSKTLNVDFKPQTANFSYPEFVEEAAIIIQKLRTYSPSKLQKLMKINPQLAELNVNRYLNWQSEISPENSKPALLSFKGEVYNGLNAETLSEDDLEFAQDHLRILSGMYGVLRPLDLIQPYRLEIGTSLKINQKKDLYHYWESRPTGHIKKLLEDTNQQIIINLASDEYFKVVDTKKLNTRIIKPVFKDFKNGAYKFITVYGKKARGMITRFILKNRIENVDELKLFDEDGYFYNDQLSQGNEWVFTRG